MRTIIPALLLLALPAAASAQVRMTAQAPRRCATPQADLAAAAATSEQVSDPVRYVSGPPPRYPAAERQAGRGGKVTIEFVVDTLGKVDPCSMRVTTATDSVFVEPARNTILGSTFKPAKQGDQLVSQLVTQAVNFQTEGK